MTEVENKTASPAVQLYELSLEYAWHAVERSTSHFARAETKANIHGTFIGAALTISLAGLAIAFPKQAWLAHAGLGAQILYLVGVSLLTLAFYHCFQAIVGRKLTELPKISGVCTERDGFLKSPEDGLVNFHKRICDHLHDVELSYTEAGKEKYKAVNSANKFTVWGLMTLVVSGLLALIHIA
jgi:hypothetical protein